MREGLSYEGVLSQARRVLLARWPWLLAAAVGWGLAERSTRGLPMALMMDGVIEWRHEWEDPNFGAGGRIAYYQPIVTDKVACIGWQAARTLEAWGNVGKCEIIGMPRFDQYLEQPVALVPHDGKKRLLIMTANTPGFTPEQIAQVDPSGDKTPTLGRKRSFFEELFGNIGTISQPGLPGTQRQ